MVKSVTTEEKKNFDLEVSHLEVILLVLVVFMEFIHINKDVMCINKTLLYFKKLLLSLSLLSSSSLLSLLLLLLLLDLQPENYTLRSLRTFAPIATAHL